MKRFVRCLLTISILLFACKKHEKKLAGDWELVGSYVNGNLQPESDTCTILTIRRNKDQFFLRRRSCSSNSMISTAEGEWEFINKKKTIKMKFIQTSIPNPQNSGVWHWDILTLTEDELTIEYDSWDKIKYEFKKQ